MASFRWPTILAIFAALGCQATAEDAVSTPAPTVTPSLIREIVDEGLTLMSNYGLNFDLTIYDTYAAAPQSILQRGGARKNGNYVRQPGIFVDDGTAQLRFRTSTDFYSNSGCNTSLVLELGQTYNIDIEVRNEVKATIAINGDISLGCTIDYTTEPNNYLLYVNESMPVYVGGAETPYPPAFASIDNIQWKNLSDTGAPTPSPSESVGTKTTCYQEGQQYYKGNTIKTFSGMGSVDKCYAQCSAYAGACEGFTFDDNGTCKLKAKAYKMKTGQSGYTSGPLECPRSAECEIQFAAYTGEEMGKIQSVSTAADCADNCLSRTGCKAWTFNSNKNVCSLLKTEGEMISSKSAFFFTGTAEKCIDIVGTPTSAPTLAPIPSVTTCGATIPNDVVFVLDASGSVDGKEWNKMKEYTRQLGSAFTLGTDGTDSRLAVVSFASGASVEWDFNDERATDESAFQLAASKLQNTNKGTSVGAGLISAKKLLDEAGIREGINKRVVILVAEGKPNNNVSCKENGYSSNVKTCAKQAGFDLMRGEDGVFDTEDDIFFVYVRMGKRPQVKLFNGEEDVLISTNVNDIFDTADTIIGAICGLQA